MHMRKQSGVEIKSLTEAADNALAAYVKESTKYSWIGRLDEK